MDRLAAAFRELPRQAGTWVVGGSVRDVLLGRQPGDFDLVVDHRPDRYARRLAAEKGGRLVALGRPGHGIFRVILGPTVVDVSALFGGTITADLSRRDFTIGALAFDLNREQVIDIFGGIEDLAHETVRMVSEAGFRADPLRMLRAYRIAAQLSFTLDPPTSEAIARHRKLLHRSAGERVHGEFAKLLRNPVSTRYLRRMAESGLLFEVFPELAALRGLAGGSGMHHRFDALEHTLTAYSRLEAMNGLTGRLPPEASRRVDAHFDPDRTVLLKWALLLHDIGKPSTRSTGPDGRVHFYNHCREGARMVEAVAGRLRMSNRESEYIRFVVRHHLAPLMLFNAGAAGNPTRKAKTRFFIRCGDRSPDIILHGMADMAGKSRDTDQRAERFLHFARDLLTAFWGEFRPRSAQAPLINGRDLVSGFGLTSSPVFSTLLAMVEEHRLRGRISSRKEALDLVADWLNRHRAPQ